MPGFEGSTRRSRLPKNWPAIRSRILKRDGHQCTWTTEGFRCIETATDVDHIIAGDDHSESNLRSLCSMHHRRKSASEGGSAPKTIRVKPRRRPPEQHPGMLH